MQTRRLVLLTLPLLVPVRPGPALSLDQAASGAVDGELFGHIELLGPTGRAVSQAGSVIWLPGVETRTAPLAGRPTMSSRNKRFDPHVVVVPSGTTVTFPNVDGVYHNVFSLSAGHAFDLGL